jgi:hypothetical protein
MNRFYVITVFTMVFFSLLILSAPCSALTWQEHFVGAGIEDASRVVQSEDGGYVILGGKNYDIYLNKASPPQAAGYFN